MVKICVRFFPSLKESLRVGKHRLGMWGQGWGWISHRWLRSVCADRSLKNQGDRLFEVNSWIHSKTCPLDSCLPSELTEHAPTCATILKRYPDVRNPHGCDTGRRDEWGEGCAGEAESVLSAWWYSCVFQRGTWQNLEKYLHTYIVCAHNTVC